MGRLVVVSNRIPGDGAPSGGLVVALHDTLSKRGGVWIGSSGETHDVPSTSLREVGSTPYRRLAYDLSHEDHEEFYLGYSNSVLWPLFHYKPDLIDLHDGYFDRYAEVNRRVAKMVADVLEPDDLLWIHDYHFLPLAQELRALGVTNRIGFFLHIPFPNAQNLPALPEAREVPHWLAACDLVGLQTKRDVAACRESLRVSEQVEFLGESTIRCGGRTFTLAHFPIGIDAKGFAELARTAPAPTMAVAANTKIVLGVDRLDYSKGLVHRFQGFGAFLEHRQPGSMRATLLQIAPPSRSDVEAYADLREQLDMISGSINGAHAELDWTPIRYIRRPVDRDALAAIYRRSAAALVTPLADGMNLVAKEYVAAQDPEDPGVLILSHFAGAVEQLEEAIVVNPYDATNMAEGIEQALTMPLDERQRRHASLWRNVCEEDVEWWTRRFLDRLEQDAQVEAA
ncbi:trehalose-6-phosphate synthase [Silicimonas algicola]|uniref:Trehalose 6-phosphate synthase n=1 Tax=Silicimonas algicola TaxID=1826607 RepID=A0A316G2I6_9RHOB|nr:trehalose-6-phosphate synthase [Silicimonas algicola]AZQ69000.1 trehalose-6-phosphate synthase [Silicimonas algicola]PWK54116.1 trehalose 6-phosphate synthase [Silicimonas algicola]